MAEGDLPNSRMVYDLITANNLAEIRSLLNPLTLRHREAIVSQRVNDKTLIVYACILRLRHIVKYLVDECEADVSVRSVHEYVGLSPLRVSITNLDVAALVLLISRGALFADGKEAVSCSLYTLSVGYFSIYAIVTNYASTIEVLERMSKTANLMSTVVRANIDNDHPYFTAAIYGDVQALKTLLPHNIDPRATNIYGENALCLTILNEWRYAEHFLINYRVFTLKEHVQALEFCGAKFVALESKLEKGLRCWRKSIRIRTETFLGVSDKFEYLIDTELGLEFQSEEELDILENYRPQIYIQSLIILVRFLPASSIVLHNAFYTVADLPILQTDLLQPIKILGALAQLPYFPVSRRVTQLRISINAVTMMFRSRFVTRPANVDNVLSNVTSILAFMKGVNWEVLLSRFVEFYSNIYMQLIKSLVNYLIDLKRLAPSIDLLCIKDEITDILKWNRHPYPTTLLHVSLMKPAASELIPFIISCADDVNCHDFQGNTPMHIVAHQPEDDTYLLRLVNLLADAGGHIDLLNQWGMSALMMLKSKEVVISPLRFRSLQCLAANAIFNNNVPIPEHYPKILTAFIKLHSQQTQFLHRNTIQMLGYNIAWYAPRCASL